MYHGLINIYKEKGYTSHDVVAILRGVLKQKKIGHTGTLDPQAEGVLPVCLGKGTKLCDMLTDKDKIYQVKLRLGVETDTEDMTGTILKESDTLELEETKVEEVIKSFVGKQIRKHFQKVRFTASKEAGDPNADLIRGRCDRPFVIVKEGVKMTTKLFGYDIFT